jgi:hypothetical protein
MRRADLADIDVGALDPLAQRAVGQIEITATSPILRSPTLRRPTASALNSDVNFLRFRPMVEHSYRTLVRVLVSTETGKDQAVDTRSRET